MKVAKSKPAPPPVIDLGGWLCLIDTSGPKPVWKKLERLDAAMGEACVARALAKHKLAGAWVRDDLGDKWWVSA